MTDEAQEFFSTGSYSVSPKATSFSSCIAVIENRALIGECLALCLRNKLQVPVLTYRDLTSWDLDPAGSSASAVILSGTGYDGGEQSGIFRDLCRRQREIPVIVFSDNDEKEQIARSLKCGVRGYIPSDTPFEIASRAIKLVMAGGVFIPASIVMGEDDKAGCMALKNSKVEFTPREYDVVRRLQKGESNKLIAHQLNLSESSVKVHIRNIMRRLGVHNRTEAVIALAALIQKHAGPSENEAAILALGALR